MPAQALVSISFEAESIDEVETIVAGLTGLPVGAAVSTSVTEVLASGTVDDNGELVAFAPSPPENGGT